MTTDIATNPVDENLLALLGAGDSTTPEEYIASAAYFTTVWKKSGDDAQAQAKARGLDPSGQNVHFGYVKGGLWEFVSPFQFYLLASKEVFSIVDGNGRSIKQVAKVLPDDPKKEDYKDGYIALLVVQQGQTLVPVIASTGRFQGGMAKAIKQARLAVQTFAADNLASRGPAYTVAAGVKAKKFRCLFTLGATVEKNDSGQLWLKGGVSQRPVTTDDLAIAEENEILNPESPFFKDLAECSRVYNLLAAQIDVGWEAKEGD